MYENWLQIAMMEFRGMCHHKSLLGCACNEHFKKEEQQAFSIAARNESNLHTWTLIMCYIYEQRDLMNSTHAPFSWPSCQSW